MYICGDYGIHIAQCTLNENDFESPAIENMECWFNIGLLIIFIKFSNPKTEKHEQVSQVTNLRSVSFKSNYK